MSDVILDKDEQVTVQCNNLNVQGHDFLLDSSARRKPGGPRFRRALVHNQNDGLTANFNRDYPGGVTIDGALKVAEIIPQQHHLVVHGRISYVTPAVPPVTEGFPPKVIKPGKPASTVFVDKEIRMLQSQISDLVAKVAALEAKIG